MRPERRCKSGMDGGLQAAVLISPPLHLRTADFLSNRWGPPQMPHFLDKCWVLYSTTKDNPFYISDNPIAMFNSNQDPLRGTLGLRVPGIEVHMPLSSTLSLGFLCPTLEREIRGSYDLASALGHPVPLHVHQLVDAFGGNRPLPLDDEHIKHLNSLQVFFAVRFLFTSRDNFDLVREMLRCTPKVKSGPRLAGLVKSVPG